MERLTKREIGGVVLVGETIADMQSSAGMALNRLAAYEDTGLGPEAVRKLKRIAQIFNCDPRDPSQLNVFCDKLEKIASDLEEGQLVILSQPPIGWDWRFEESQDRLEVRARLFRTETEKREETER